MKKFVCALMIILASVLTGCHRYEFKTGFTLPTELDAPEVVILDVSSAQRYVFSWSGGAADDGGIILYTVLFDKEGGDFSAPLAAIPSDKGSQSRLTMTQAQLSTIARKGGVAPNQTGNFIWTVQGAKGGDVKRVTGSKSISITRGDGIDVFPEQLVIGGSAAVEAGQLFKQSEEGVYTIITRLQAGSLFFASEDGSARYVLGASGVLTETSGDDSFELSAAPATGLGRMTVNFNTLSVSCESLGMQVRAQWAANNQDFAVLYYVGDGAFEGSGEAVFLGPGRAGTPSWCSWTEERYSLIAEVEGNVVRWGSQADANGAQLPDGTPEFFYIYEQEKTDWEGLWKMDHALDLKYVKVTVYIDDEGHLTHSIEETGEIEYRQPSETPATLTLQGSAAESEGQAFRKDGNRFIVYSRLSAGKLSFADESGRKYFIQDEGDLYMGDSSSEVEGTEQVNRITVDFGTNTVKMEEVSASVRLVWAWTQETAVTLNYIGMGRYSGDGELHFPGEVDTTIGWPEERYSFYLTVDGAQKCWGRLDTEDAENRPDGEVSPTFYDLGEFEVSQWDHLWKMASALSESLVTVTIDTNADGHIRHSFFKQSVDPFPPVVAPTSLALYGEGAEVEGQAFRKVSDGVFQIIAKLSNAPLRFVGGTKNYFWTATDGLLQGEGETAAMPTASEADATRLTVNFNDCTLTAETINKVRALYSATFEDIVTMNYTGAGTWSGSGTVYFRAMGWGADERYYFIPTTDGEQRLCWGRLDGVDGENRPDGGQSANYFDCGEFGWSQWEHCWKLPTATDKHMTTITLYSNKDGIMTHTISVE